MNRGEDQLGNIANINQHNTRQIGNQRAGAHRYTASALSMLNMHIKTVRCMIRCVIHRTINSWRQARIANPGFDHFSTLRYARSRSGWRKIKGFLATRRARHHGIFTGIQGDMFGSKSRDKGSPMILKDGEKTICS